MNPVGAQYAKCQTQPWTRNNCYITLNLIEQQVLKNTIKLYWDT
jgi:hypothetical protein